MNSELRRFKSATIVQYSDISENEGKNADNKNVSNNDNDDDDDEILDFWKERWEAADALEVRLDCTLVTCHTLARFLCFDMTLPAKQVPGLEIADIIMLLHTFSSAVLLALLWTMAGLAVQLFEDAQDLYKVSATTILAAPLWILLERALGWSLDYDNIVQQILLGSTGLWATMTLSRSIPKAIR